MSRLTRLKGRALAMTAQGRVNANEQCDSMTKDTGKHVVHPTYMRG